MKNSSGAAGQHLSREIGFLARRIIDEDVSKETVRREIERRFAVSSTKDREEILSRIVQRCYAVIWMASAADAHMAAAPRQRARSIEPALPVTSATANATFILRSALILAGLLGAEPHRYSRGNGFCTALFDSALDSLIAQGLLSECDGDPELALINLKQAALILKNSSIVKDGAGLDGMRIAAANPIDLYRSLFYSFWNRIKWERLFPSMPDAAGILQLNRSIAADIVLRNVKPFSLYEAAGEIIEMTGMGRRNNLILVSFIDFSLFTWLRHFGIVEYCAGARTAAVRAKLSEHGRTFLGTMQHQ